MTKPKPKDDLFDSGDESVRRQDAPSSSAPSRVSRPVETGEGTRGRTKAAAPPRSHPRPHVPHPTSKKPETKPRETKPAPRPDKPTRPPKAARAIKPLPVPATAQPVNLLSLVGQAIMNPQVDAAKLTALVDWYDKREADNAFARDYLAMAKKLPAIKQDGTIDQGTTRSGRQGVKSKYATYPNIHKVTSPILHEHGFTLSSFNTIIGQQTMLVLRLEHYDPRAGSSFRESVRPIVADESGGKTSVQAIESGAQYFLRRMVIKLLNLRSDAPEDDDRDGNDPAKVAAAEHKAKDDARPVNAAQLKELREKIAATGGRISEERVCEKYAVEKLEKLPMARHLDACKALDNVIEASRG